MRLLITTSQLESYGGSEMVVLELVEWFVSNGWHVTLLCANVDSVMLRELSKQVSDGMLDILTSEDGIGRIGAFDLVWITHNVWPRKLFGGKDHATASTKTITLHMGSLESVERAVLPEIENSKVDRILVVSGRTEERMVDFGLDGGLINTFDNPVPNSFLGLTQRESASLESVLFISNHLPHELAESYRQLTDAGIHVTHLGLGGDQFERISPDLVLQCDAVVTIGKSTQYCLVMGIPVYSYDHFGGAGWLSSDNFAFEAFNNFTGYQTARKLTAEEITSEIRTGFDAARKWSRKNRGAFAHHYSLDRQMSELLKSLTILD